MIPHRLLLYSVCACKWVLKDTKRGCFKREHHKQDCYDTKHRDRCLGVFAGNTLVELPCFIDIGYCGRNKEDSDIQPIRGLTDNAVIGVKENRDKKLTEKYAT